MTGFSRAHRSSAQRGFSLIEMVLSLTLVGLVLASLGSVLAFAMGAAPKADDPSIRLRETQFPLGVMTEEIASATRFISISSTKIAFEVADRTADAVSDTITYSWDGTPGSPLLRAINAETATEVLTEIEQFAFIATTTDHSYTTLHPGSEVKFERELSADTSTFTRVVALLNSRMQRINQYEGFSQRLRSDDVPGSALYWVPSYADVLMQREALGGTIRLELRIASAGAPTSRAIAARVIKTSDLGGETWVRLEVPGTLMLNPSDELCLVVICTGGSNTASVRVFEQLVFASESAMHQSKDSGANWGTGLTTRLGYRLQGYYLPEAKSETVTSTVVERIRVELTPGATSQTRIVSEIDLPAPVRLEP